MGARILDRLIHIVFTLVVIGDATNSIAIKANFNGFFGRPFTEIFIRSALNDAKEILVGVIKNGFATFSPTNSAFDAIFEIFVIGGGWWAFVKTHSNVGIELVLNFDGFFRREEEFAAVNFGFKMDAFFSDIFLFVARKTENLVTAGIS